MSNAVQQARRLVNAPISREELLEAIVLSQQDDILYACHLLRLQRDLLERFANENGDE